jgi:hypothetical protein
LRVAEVAQRARHLGGLTALTAGVEHLDLGVGEFGGDDLGHRRRGYALTQRDLGRVGRRGRRIARRRLLHFGRLVERDQPYDE